MITHPETHPAIQLADLHDDRHHLVDGIVAQVVRRGMRRATMCRDLQFDTPLVPAIDAHLGRLANEHKVRAHSGIDFDEGVGRDAVAPLFHVAKVVGREAIQ